jgi:rod shape-determining protein MreC
LLITDPSHSVPVQVDRSGQRAIAVGTGSDDSLELAYVPRHGDVRVGDALVSSGLGGSFPPGYQVGIVQHVQARPGEPFVSVRVSPSARLRYAREVLLLWPGGPRDPSPVTHGRFALSNPKQAPLR